ncbi:MAG: putative Nudix hydrolase NudL [Acidimicrobiaceae bacterium]|nr:putative Nudix hydrolase NudL [Acidimicrobiaceae bacterium]
MIRRPDGWVEGGPPPWAGLARPAPTITDLSLALSLHEAVPVCRSGTPVPDRTSAVLIPLYESHQGVSVILTRRSPSLRSHGHEVSFPGGGHDVADADHWATALREAHEEIGLDPALPTRLGELDRWMTVGSRSWIHTYVAELADMPELVPDPSEVELILHVPLADLLDEGVFSEELWPIDGDVRTVTFFELAGDTVWGATAAMLRQLLCLGLGVTDRQR